MGVETVQGVIAEACAQALAQLFPALVLLGPWIEQLAATGLPELSGLAQWLRGAQNGVEFSRACASRMVGCFDRLDATHGPRRLGCR